MFRKSALARIEYIQPVVTSIRSVASNVILMGSPSWSNRLSGAVTDPIAGGNIAHVYHLYPNRVRRPQAAG